MNRRRIIILLCSVLIALGMICFFYQPQRLLVSINESGTLEVSTDDILESIKAWEKENVNYIFVPSYIKCEEMYFAEEYVLINEEVLEKNEMTISWGSIFSLQLGEIQKYVCFVHSENVATMHLTMSEGAFTELYSDKEAKCVADMSLIEANGRVNYQGTLEYISGRGNASWRVNKKSHTIKLKEAYPLLGMDSGKKWILLANTHDGTKMLNKMTADIARQIGMDYVQQSDWIDLYINGEYQGNYLLVEKIEVNRGKVDITDLDKLNQEALSGNIPIPFSEENYKGYEQDNIPENITGGYLLEKDYQPYYEEESCGFMTNRLQPFTIKSPSVATREEVEYISNFVTKIDDLMSERDENVLQYIDKKSFYRKFLMDEIALNKDSNITSAYYYKKQNEDVLYSGPVWDYDEAYGEARTIWLDYTQSVLDVSELRGLNDLALDWYNAMYSFDSCRQEIIEEYKQILPVYEYYLAEGIDEYYNKIRHSITMDMILWDYGTCRAGYYMDYENIIRYLKYFLYHRLSWLNDRWDVEYKLTEPITTGKIHDIYVTVNGETYTLYVEDGDCISQEQFEILPKGYEYKYIRDNQKVNLYMPVYETQYIITE